MLSATVMAKLSGRARAVLSDWALKYASGSRIKPRNIYRNNKPGVNNLVDNLITNTLTDCIKFARTDNIWNGKTVQN